MKKTIDIITIFPQMFKEVFDQSIIKRAQQKNILSIKLHDLREHTQLKHNQVDDMPYGGGPGMLFRIEPIYEALKSIKKNYSDSKPWIVLLTPQGKRFNSKLAKKLSKKKHLVLLAARYEGVDERVNEYLIDEEISIGDYVLTGGEIPAMVIVDAVTRFYPKVVGDKESVRNDSFEGSLLDFPQYTRPQVFRNWEVPKILLSGDHKKIAQWRSKKAYEKTRRNRPDLLKKNKNK